MRDYLSASFVEDYLRCPYRAITVREEGVDTSSVFTELGTLVHKTLEKYYESDASIQEIYQEEVENVASPDLKMYRDAQKMLKNFEMEEALSTSKLLSREVEFELDLEPESDSKTHARVKGVIDRVDYVGDGVFEIIDYKTSMFVKERWELENDLQMSIYDLAFWELWKDALFFDPYKMHPERLLVSIHYLRYGKWRLPERTQEQRDSLKKYLIQMFKVVRENEPKPKINKYCPYCPYRNSCDAFQKAVGTNPNLFALDDLTPNEMAAYYEELRTKKALIDKRLDEVKDKMRRLILAEDGPVETDEYLVSSSVKKYKVRDMQDVKGILEPLDLFDSVLEVSNKKLEKVAKENDLTDAVDRITTYSFSKPMIDVKKKPATPS